MKDYAAQIRQEFLRNIYQQPQQVTIQQKIAKLGKSWVLHPEYNRADNPAHTNPGSEYLRSLRARAIMAGRI